jgi:hypothetical protein
MGHVTRNRGVTCCVGKKKAPALDSGASPARRGRAHGDFTRSAALVGPRERRFAGPVVGPNGGAHAFWRPSAEDIDGEWILALFALAGSSPTGASDPPALGGFTVDVHSMAGGVISPNRPTEFARPEAAKIPRLLIY